MAIVFNSIRHGHRSRRLFETLRRSSLGLQRDFARIYTTFYQAANRSPAELPWLLRAAYIWSAKRRIEQRARLPGFGSSVGSGLMPRPWRWRRGRAGGR